MATEQGIGQAIILLEGAGFTVPRSLASRPEVLTASWKLMTPDVTDEELVQAAIVYGRSGERFFPQVGQLVAIAKHRNVDDWAVAWGNLIERVRRCGWPNPPEPGELDDPTFRGLRAVGGWRSLCQLEDSDIGPARAAFRSAYQSTTKRVRHLEDKAAADQFLAELGQRQLKAITGGKT